MDASIMFICCTGAILIVPIFGSATWYIVDVLRGQSAHTRLAEQGGYQLIHESQRKVQSLYGGKIKGRPFVFRPSAERTRSYNHEGRSRVNVHMHMQIIVPLKTNALAGISLRRNKYATHETTKFIELWSVSPDYGLVPQRIQTIMSAFVRDMHPRGFYGGGYRWRPKLRTLNLAPRAAVKANFPEKLFSGVTTLLYYDHPVANLSLGEFNQIVHELIELAIAIDTDPQ